MGVWGWKGRGGGGKSQCGANYTMVASDFEEDNDACRYNFKD